MGVSARPAMASGWNGRTLRQHLGTLVHPAERPSVLTTGSDGSGLPSPGRSLRGRASGRGRPGRGRRSGGRRRSRRTSGRARSRCPGPPGRNADVPLDLGDDQQELDGGQPAPEPGQQAERDADPADQLDGDDAPGQQLGQREADRRPCATNCSTPPSIFLYPWHASIGPMTSRMASSAAPEDSGPLTNGKRIGPPCMRSPFSSYLTDRGPVLPRITLPGRAGRQPFPASRLPPLRPHPPVPGDGDPQPHAGLLLRPGCHVRPRSHPAAGRGAGGRGGRHPRRRRRQGRARARRWAKRRNSTGSSPPSRRWWPGSTCRCRPTRGTPTCWPPPAPPAPWSATTSAASATPTTWPPPPAAGASVVATHIRLAPRVRDPEPHYDDLVGDVAAFLVDRAERALAAGLAADQIVLDAGLDLGKTAAAERRAAPGERAAGVARLPAAAVGLQQDVPRGPPGPAHRRPPDALARRRGLRRAPRVPDRARPRRRRYRPGRAPRRADPRSGRSRRRRGVPHERRAAASTWSSGDDARFRADATKALIAELLGDDDPSLALEEFSLAPRSDAADGDAVPRRPPDRDHRPRVGVDAARSAPNGA